MSKLLIDLDLIEEGSGKNPFEALMSKVENLSLQGNLTIDKADIEKKVLYLERKCQDFKDENSDKSKVIMQAVNAIAASIEEKDLSYLELAENLYRIVGIANHMENLISNPVNFFIAKELSKSQTNRGKFTSHEISNALKTIYQKINFKPLNASHLEEWIIELKFNTLEEEHHLPLEFIHTFIESLNKIEGVKLTLEDIKIGSITAKIKAVFDNARSKEEVKELLESARKFAKGRLEKDFSEVELNNAESKKVEVETKLLEEELKEIESPEFYEQKKLKTEALKLELDKKRLENELARINLFKERKNLLRELLVDGIIQQREFEMLIKGLPFLKIENGNLTIGENINIIDDL